MEVEVTEMRRPGTSGTAALDELKEFATFGKGTQRYIRQSLDVAHGRAGAALHRARNPAEAASIRGQALHYARLAEVRASIPDGDEPGETARFMAGLAALTATDLAAGRIACFTSYRFLYERLLGAAVRPWLLSAFCAAAALPAIHPQQRVRLLASVSASVASAAGWSSREPRFFPIWVEECDLPILSPGG
jgi:hypothetical protein